MTVFRSINQIISILLMCSAALLITVLYFEYVLDLKPCKLCTWQRVPHIVVLFLGLFILTKNSFKTTLCSLCTLLIFSGVLLSGYHVGVEYKLWSGPVTCSGNNLSTTLSANLFLEAILNTPIVRCDEIKWSFMGISMAGWNFLISFVLSITWSIITVYFIKLYRNQLSSSASQ